VIQNEQLRLLRYRARNLGEKLQADLAAYENATGSYQYHNIPGKSSLSVATTCTAWMVLPLGGPKLEDAVKAVFDAEWGSAGLPDGNAFTLAVVARGIGSLYESGYIDQALIQTPHNWKRDAESSDTEKQRAELLNDYPVSTTLPELCNWFIDRPDRLGVQRYPANPAIAYWIVDAMRRLKIFSDSKYDRSALYAWATREFFRQFAYSAAGDESRMDPVGLGMSACLLSLLHRIAQQDSATLGDLVEGLPPSNVIVSGLRMALSHQTATGVWRKYVPLFHFPESGADYCFSFELLEAVVEEFGQPTNCNWHELGLIEGMEKALSWCEQNRLIRTINKSTHGGWNSGGDPKLLASLKPEGWATFVVHNWCHLLVHRLSHRLAENVLTKYRATRYENAATLPKREAATAASKKATRWDRFIDLEIPIDGVLGSRSTVKTILENEVLLPARTGSLKRRAVLLFGPPGTSKTSLVEAATEFLGWSFIEITPAHFLEKNIDGIPEMVGRIFDDLMELDRTVVLFDEMDSLVRKREKHVDLAHELFTTSMLPRLAKLYNHRRIIYFLATNHFQRTDAAITRPGRFDTWLCMGPPLWKSKLERIQIFCPQDKEIPALQSKLADYAGEAGSETSAQLDRFLFGELKAFFESILRRKGKESVLESLGDDATSFRMQVQEWARSTIHLRGSEIEDGEDELKNFENERVMSRLQ
jgi:AAA+ superfamily predicted ATPase